MARTGAAGQPSLAPRKRETETTEVEGREKRAWSREVQPVVSIRRGGACVEGNNRLGGQDLAQFGIHTLGLQGLGVEAGLGHQAGLALGPECLGFLSPHLAIRPGTVSPERLRES
jgi:hypothetical protein